MILTELFENSSEMLEMSSEILEISTEMLEISLPDIVEILTKPADLEVQPVDLIFNGVKPQTHPKICKVAFLLLSTCFYLSSRYSFTLKKGIVNRS